MKHLRGKVEVDVKFLWMAKDTKVILAGLKDAVGLLLLLSLPFGPHGVDLHPVARYPPGLGKGLEICKAQGESIVICIDILF